MAYLELSTGQVDANSPLDTTLFQQIRNNQIEFNSRLSGQTIHVQSNATVRSTVAIPIDDTIPRNTEGVEFLTAVITPASSSDKVVIDVECVMGIDSSAVTGTIALFQDSNTASIQAKKISFPSESSLVSVGSVRLRHIIDPIGTTAASTFAIRVGSNTTNNIVMNKAVSGGFNYGGTMFSNMTITEIATT